MRVYLYCTSVCLYIRVLIRVRMYQHIRVSFPVIIYVERTNENARQTRDVAKKY